MRRWLGVQTVTASWYSIKGGSYVPQQESFLRTYMRRGWPADRHSPLLGFRCVRDVKNQNR
ncbi:MAG: hypothetical protein M3Z85_22415, partial [Acidobacteriota bacterium]|nr:hypothetical protein [Acidobacteriota bacterium]